MAIIISMRFKYVFEFRHKYEASALKSAVAETVHILLNPIMLNQDEI
jgi:hypothetical protein